MFCLSACAASGARLIRIHNTFGGPDPTCNEPVLLLSSLHYELSSSLLRSFTVAI